MKAISAPPLRLPGPCIAHLKKLIIRSAPGLYGKYVLYRRFHAHKLSRKHHQQIKLLREANKVEVVFIMSSLSMWRLEPVCEELKKDDRFHVSLIISPFRTFVEEQQEQCKNELKAYCDQKGWTYQVWRPGDYSRQIPKADIFFYPQLYDRLFDNPLDLEKNLDRLIAYVPYGLPTVSGDWMYNSPFMNTLWKLFFPTELHLQYARKHSHNHAKNMEIVGDSHAAEFILGDHPDGWKGQAYDKKKIIWAPHFSFGDKGCLHRASFLWLSAAMLEIANEYADQIQFVFKPHPRLMSELYRHPDWGKDKTDAYFAQWMKGDNTQLETGRYVDLFCTSDGMIHDCGSFTAEYLYTGKPVLFVAQDFDSIYQGLDSFGSRCMDMHYHGSNISGIRHFLDDVVLKGEDRLFLEREHFRSQFLTTPENLGFEKKIHRSLVRSVFGE